jgi:hypothetical protein
MGSYLTFKGINMAFPGMNLNVSGTPTRISDLFQGSFALSGIFCLVRGKFDHFREKYDIFRDLLHCQG